MSNIIITADQRNYEDADLYCFERKKLTTFNWFLKTHTNIFSNVFVEIHPHRDLIKRNKDFFNNLIYVRLKGSPDFCKKTRCNLLYPRGQTCNEKDELKIFKSGNSNETACEAGCFKMFDKVNGPLTNWSKRCNACLQYNKHLYGIGIDDYNRSKEHPTPHIDTIGTGYDIDEEPYIDEEGDETFHFKLNKFYCENFNMNLYKDHCGHNTGEAILGFFIGDTIYSLIKYLFTDTIHGTSIYTVKNPNVGPVPDSFIKNAQKLDNSWNDINTKYAFYINPDITLSDLGIDKTNMHMYWTTEHDDFGGGLKEPLLVYKNVEYSTQIINGKKPVPYQFRINPETGMRNIDEYEIANVRPIRAVFNDDSTLDGKTDHEKLMNTITTAAKITGVLAASIATDILIRHLIQNVLPAMLESAMKVIGRQISKHMVHMLAHNVVKDIATIFIRASLSQLVVQTFKSLAIGAFKYFNIATLILFALDLLVYFIDPLHMKSLGTQESIDIYSKIEMKIKEINYGYKTLEFSPIMYILLIESESSEDIHEKISNLKKTESEKQENVKFHPLYKKIKTPAKPNISINALKVDKYDLDVNFTVKHHAAFLSALKYNSNGQVINWKDFDIMDVDELLKKHLHPENIYNKPVNEKLLKMVPYISDKKSINIYENALKTRKIMIAFTIAMPLSLFILINLTTLYTLTVFFLMITSTVFITYMSIINGNLYKIEK